MIDGTTFKQRRDALRAKVPGGVIVLFGQLIPSRNYRDNFYPFRQNSHLLYYTGIDRPGIVLVFFEGSGKTVLFGAREEIDDVVWYGPHLTLEDQATLAGIEGVEDLASLGAVLAAEIARGRRVHYLPTYRADAREWLATLFARPIAAIDAGASPELARAIVDQRLHKTDDEVAEIEDALQVTQTMHIGAMRATRPGRTEAEIAAEVFRAAFAKNRVQAYNPIVTVHGEVLHADTWSHTLSADRLLLNDSGAESPRGYASDITRTYPVSGRFSTQQRDVYDVVLAAQKAAIAACRPGIRYGDIHRLASLAMAKGMKAIGLMRGAPEEAVEAGAHALFFPHGLGHMLGLDVHDMEDLGDVVGYPAGEARSSQFGLNYLRMSRPLETGFVFTVEPGAYFIPALIDRWRAEGRHAEFIAYEKVDSFRQLGGIRIEDDVLCTQTGSRVLGPGIPKERAELEALVGKDAA